MTTQNENLPANIEILDPENTTRNKLFVTIAGQDWQKDLEELSLTINSSEEEIMSIIVPIIQEEFNEDISDTYKIRKAINNENIFIIPNSTAGSV